MLDTLLEKANNLPQLPGVYIMLDEKGEVIYVGKAKRLKNRVTSYFRGEHLPKVAAMVDKVRDFNVIVASSEFEALILENSLIKRHKPHYDILLKDDKGYPFIRIDMKSAYPQLSVSRNAPKDGACYYGPFGGRSQTREIIDVIRAALLLPDAPPEAPGYTPDEVDLVSGRANSICARHAKATAAVVSRTAVSRQRFTRARLRAPQL